MSPQDADIIAMDLTTLEEAMVDTTTYIRNLRTDLMLDTGVELYGALRESLALLRQFKEQFIYDNRQEIASLVNSQQYLEAALPTLLEDVDLEPGKYEIQVTIERD